MATSKSVCIVAMYFLPSQGHTQYKYGLWLPIPCPLGDTPKGGDKTPVLDDEKDQKDDNVSHPTTKRGGKHPGVPKLSNVGGGGDHHNQFSFFHQPHYLIDGVDWLISRLLP